MILDVLKGVLLFAFVWVRILHPLYFLIATGEENL